ncbi:hypothetical protein EE612_027911, partial [Oryza sativa]
PPPATPSTPPPTPTPTTPTTPSRAAACHPVRAVPTRAGEGATIGRHAAGGSLRVAPSTGVHARGALGVAAVGLGWSCDTRAALGYALPAVVWRRGELAAVVRGRWREVAVDAEHPPLAEIARLALVGGRWLRGVHGDGGGRRRRWPRAAAARQLHLPLLPPEEAEAPAAAAAALRVPAAAAAVQGGCIWWIIPAKLAAKCPTTSA